MSATNVVVQAQIESLTSLIVEAERREESARKHRDVTDRVAKSARDDYRLAIGSLNTLKEALWELQAEHDVWARAATADGGA